jgi:hypothetical protein
MWGKTVGLLISLECLPRSEAPGPVLMARQERYTLGPKWAFAKDY